MRGCDDEPLLSDVLCKYFKNCLVNYFDFLVNLSSNYFHK